MSKRLRSRFALFLVLLIGAAGAAAPARGQGAGGDTSAVAINTKDGSSVFTLAFEIRRVTGEVVDNQNLALAYASCNQCQTVAISIQVLLIAGSPSIFTPQNVAVAINDNCTLCSTMALAYQFAVGMDTKLKFTKEGKRQLAVIRKQLEDLRDSNLSIEDIQARAAELMNQLSTVLATQLVGVKPEGEQGASNNEGQHGSTDTTPQATPPKPTETTPTVTTPTETTPTDTTPTTDTTKTAPPPTTAPAP